MLFRAFLTAALIALVASAAAAERKPSAGRADPCAVHGPGFREIEGTGACVKVGGSVRGEATAGARTRSDGDAQPPRRAGAPGGR